ncbi:hypothetical protein ACFONG_09560 [Uliginosibacterium paludis]|uniref:ApeI dehydratase-like domain-containing protein n=1 Tax=Uliginosibacterium paludis TaxID=1615952 RepID=A0ABV2CMZ9_9RHOO
MPRLELPIAANHPALAGHFPGRPVVPGVLLLDQAQLLIEAHCGQPCCGLAMAKFSSPATPADALTLDFTPTDETVRFEIRAGERLVASGRFRLGRIAA